MATSGPTQLPAFFNTDADFRNFCIGIKAGLEAAGLVNTADTGQINTATVAKPAATNTAQGYEIYRFNDTLQATRPIYIKVEYGSGGAATRPAIWVTTGTGTNGAGTLTGQVGTRTQARASSDAAAGNTLPAYFSGAQSTGDGRIGACINLNLATPSINYGIGFFVERLLDGDGNPTGDGIYTYTWSPSGTSLGLEQVIPTPAGAVPAGGTVPHTIEPKTAGAVSTFGGDVAMYPPIVPQGKLYVQTAFVVYANADLGSGGTVTVDLYGASHTYMPLGDATKGAERAINGGANTALAMRWE